MRLFPSLLLSRLLWPSDSSVWRVAAAVRFIAPVRSPVQPGTICLSLESGRYLACLQFFKKIFKTFLQIPFSIIRNKTVTLIRVTVALRLFVGFSMLCRRECHRWASPYVYLPAVQGDAGLFSEEVLPTYTLAEVINGPQSPTA